MSQEYWSGKRVFITGCSGLLGSWLTAKLVEYGALVVGLQRDHTPPSQIIGADAADSVSTIFGDICDYGLVKGTLAKYGIDTIFHLAAQTIVGVANQDPFSTFETNIRGTWTMLEAARGTDSIRRIVVASSDKAYGTQDTLPYKEESPLLGQHPYDVSKSCADLIARTYAKTYGLPISVTRCANLYGGGDLNWNRIVPGTMRSVVNGERPVVRSDGTFKRDYIYIRDAVTGYLMLAQNIHCDGVHGQAFNFGATGPLAALEMIESIIGLSDHPDLEPIILDEARNEIQDQYLSSERARRVLGWRPHFSLQGGLAETMAWYKRYLAAA